MSVFRPRNINRRLVGTATTSITSSTCPIFSGKGSPGNGGQIGPKKSPYLCSQISLGCRCCGGSCGGVFKLNESACGVKENCNCTVADCGGFFICCGPSTNKWFVAPVSAEVTRTWNDKANAATVACTCSGNCGWYVPTCAQLINPGACCKFNWDSFTSAAYWSSTQGPNHSGVHVCRINPHGDHAHNCNVAFNNNPNGLCVSLSNNAGGALGKGSSCKIRAFRCTAT